MSICNISGMFDRIPCNFKLSHTFDRNGLFPNQLELIFFSSMVCNCHGSITLPNPNDVESPPPLPSAHFPLLVSMRHLVAC